MLLRRYVKLVASVGGPQQLGGPGQWPVWSVVKMALTDTDRDRQSASHGTGTFSRG